MLAGAGAPVRDARRACAFEGPRTRRSKCPGRSSTRFSRPRWSGRIRGRTGIKQQLLGRDVRVAFKEVAARRGLPRRDRDRDPRPGRGRPRHRHRWPDVVRRLRRRRSARSAGTCTSASAASSPAREPHPADGATAADKARRAPATTGAASSTAALSREGRSACAISTRSRSRHATGRSRCRSAPGPVNLAWHVYFEHYKDAKELSYALAPDLQRRDEGPRRGRREVPAARGPRRLAAAVHGQQGRLQVDPGRDRASAARASTRRSAGTSASATPGATTS